MPYQAERVYLTLHQVNKHFALSESYKLSKARIIVGKVLSTFSIDYIKAKVGIAEDLLLEIPSLSPGKYLVFL